MPTDIVKQMMLDLERDKDDLRYAALAKKCFQMRKVLQQQRKLIIALIVAITVVLSCFAIFILCDDKEDEIVVSCINKELINTSDKLAVIATYQDTVQSLLNNYKVFCYNDNQHVLAEFKAKNVAKGFCDSLKKYLNQSAKFRIDSMNFSHSIFMGTNNYAIQFGAFNTDVFATFKPNLRTIVLVEEDGYYKYRIDSFSDFHSAKSFAERCCVKPNYIVKLN